MYMLQIGPNECMNGLETIYFEWYEQYLRVIMRSINDIYRSSEVCGASAVYRCDLTKAKLRLTQDHASAHSWDQPCRT